MTRPTVAERTTVRPAPTTERAPARSPLRASPLTGLASPLAASPLAMSPLAHAGSPLKPNSPLRRGSPFRSPLLDPRQAKRRARHLRRREVVLPALSSPRRQRSWRETHFYLPYEEVCRICEWVVGDFTYVPGMGENFDELARAAGNQECDGDCDSLDEGWCVTDRQGEHLHLLGAFELSPARLPIDCVDMDVWYDENREHLDDWREMRALIRQIKADLLAQPSLLLELMAGSSVAVGVLKAAGYEIPNGLHLGSQLIETVGEHLPTDRALRDAFGDIGAIAWSHHIEEPEDVALTAQALADLVDRCGEGNDIHLWHPDELTFLVFDPADFSDDERSEHGARLRGDWLAVDADYSSALELPDEHSDRYPFVLGWREVLMKRD